jgi:hypothetical protein
MAGPHSEVKLIVLQNTSATDFYMLTVDLHTDSDNAFGNFSKERPIIFDDVALFD